MQQKSKRESEESQLPSKSKGCNERQGFRGNCDSQASWGCAPALPNRTQVVSLRRAAGNQKFFDPTIFQKCWWGVGEQPTFAKQIVFATSDFCCNCIFKSCPIQTKLNHENQGCKFKQGNGAIAAYWQAKAGVDPPFAECYRSVSLRAFLHCFMWNAVLRKTICVRFGRIASLSAFVLFADGCVVRIIFQSFLDFRFSEFFLFPEWRTAFTNFS